MRDGERAERGLRTQVWMEAGGSLADLGDRANGKMRMVESSGGTVERIDVVPTALASGSVLYTVVMVYQDRLDLEEP